MNPLRILMEQHWRQVLSSTAPRFGLSEQEHSMLLRIRKGELFSIPAEFVRGAEPYEYVLVNLDILELSLRLWKDGSFADYGGMRTVLNFGKPLQESSCVALIDFLLDLYRSKRLHWVDEAVLRTLKNTWELEAATTPKDEVFSCNWQYHTLEQGEQQWIH